MSKFWLFFSKLWSNFWLLSEQKFYTWQNRITKKMRIFLSSVYFSLLKPTGNTDFDCTVVISIIKLLNDHFNNHSPCKSDVWGFNVLTCLCQPQWPRLSWHPPSILFKNSFFKVDVSLFQSSKLAKLVFGQRAEAVIEAIKRYFNEKNHPIFQITYLTLAVGG